MADCFYVPETMLDDILAILDAFSEARVFLEIAVPTTLMAIPESHRELLDIDFLWGKNRGIQPTIASLLGCKHGMHPLKMSTPDYTHYFQPIAESRLFRSGE